MKKLLWWGYLHTNWNAQAKRFWEDNGALDIADARKSPFVDRIHWPFQALDRDEALNILITKFK